MSGRAASGNDKVLTSVMLADTAQHKTASRWATGSSKSESEVVSLKHRFSFQCWCLLTETRFFTKNWHSETTLISLTAVVMVGISQVVL